MTTTTTTATASTAGRARRTGLLAGLGVLAVSVTLSVVDANSTGERYVDVGVQLVVAALVYLVAVPRALAARRVGAGAVLLGVAAVALVLPAFWSGLPLVLGVAAALMGAAGRRVPRPGPALVALACGLLASLGYAAVYVVDALSR